MFNYPALDSEDRYDRLLSARIRDAEDVLDAVRFRPSGKRARRTPNILQGHVTRMKRSLALRRCQLQAYQVKAQQVRRRKGNHTLGGIPAELQPVLPS